MGIGGDDFLKPVMYQDLASVNMAPMPMFGMLPGCGYGYNTSLLGNIRMPEQLDKDRYQNMQKKEKKDYKLLKKAGIALLILGGLGFVKFKAVGTWLKNKGSAIVNKLKTLVKKPTAPTP